MNIQESIVKNYPLNNKIHCAFNCYLLDKRRYLVFWDNLISKATIDQILKDIDEKTNNKNFSQWKTIVVVGKTVDSFKKEELFYFNNVSTFVVFYLIDENTGKVYMNDSWIFTLGLNYRNAVRKINKICKTELH